MGTNSTRKKRTLYYWLNVIFFLFTLGPLAGFVYLGIKYGFLHDAFIKPFLVGVLFYSLIGFTVLRKIFDKVINISREFSRKVKTDIPGVDFDGDGDEEGECVQTDRDDGDMLPPGGTVHDLPSHGQSLRPSLHLLLPRHAETTDYSRD